MDELENYTLKTFKRPLRPVALRKSQHRWFFSVLKLTFFSDLYKFFRSRVSTDNNSSPQEPNLKESVDSNLPSLKEIKRRISNQGQPIDSAYRRKHQV